VVRAEAELEDALGRAFAGACSKCWPRSILVAWKEIEYELVRDSRDNCISVCNMETWTRWYSHWRIHRGRAIANAQRRGSTKYCGPLRIRTVRHLASSVSAIFSSPLTPIARNIA